MLAFLVGAVALLVIVAVTSNAEQFEATPPETGGSQPNPRAILPIEQDLGEAVEPEAAPRRAPVELPAWFQNALAVGFLIVALFLLSRESMRPKLRLPKFRIRRSTTVEVTEEQTAEIIAEAASDLIVELNSGDSPRIAIQRAYAAVETGFGARELARRPAETPLRYLGRIFGRHDAVHAPLERLTDRFQTARFSEEPIDESMRADAIDALTEIRDYYTKHAWGRISARHARSDA